MNAFEAAITEADKRYVWAVGCLAKAAEVQLTPPRLLDGAAVLDTLGRVWTVTRDGGMVVRPTEIPPSNVESAGITWLWSAYGPFTVLYEPKAVEVGA